MLLLDSQVYVWFFDGASGRIGPNAVDEISSTSVYLSAASVWELTIKEMLGKLRLPERMVERSVEQGIRLLDVTGSHAQGIREFPELGRHDPFDRLLVSQAHQEGLELITADRVLLAMGRPFIIDATV